MKQTTTDAERGDTKKKECTPPSVITVKNLLKVDSYKCLTILTHYNL